MKLETIKAYVWQNDRVISTIDLCFEPLANGKYEWQSRAEIKSLVNSLFRATLDDIDPVIVTLSDECEECGMIHNLEEHGKDCSIRHNP